MAKIAFSLQSIKLCEILQKNKYENIIKKKYFHANCIDIRPHR